MPAIVSAIAATASARLWSDSRINDDRFFVDRTLGLAFVVDASGPTYGGYHAPFAIDPGIATFVASFGDRAGSTRERLVRAVKAAQASMSAMNDGYEAQRSGRVGLAASRAAADAVRPASWASYDSFAHFTGSLTACAVGPEAVVIAQIGGCRAYALDAGRPRQLVVDHTLAAVLEARGASRDEVEAARRDHPSVVTALLGSGSIEPYVVEVDGPRRIVLVTDGVWRCEGAIDDMLDARTEEALSRLVSRCSHSARDDATAVAFDIG